MRLKNDGIIVNWLMLMALVQIKQNSLLNGAYLAARKLESVVLSRMYLLLSLSLSLALNLRGFVFVWSLASHSYETIANEPKNREIESLRWKADESDGKRKKGWKETYEKPSSPLMVCTCALILGIFMFLLCFINSIGIQKHTQRDRHIDAPNI